MSWIYCLYLFLHSCVWEYTTHIWCSAVVYVAASRLFAFFRRWILDFWISNTYVHSNSLQQQQFRTVNGDWVSWRGFLTFLMLATHFRIEFVRNFSLRGFFLHGILSFFLFSWNSEILGISIGAPIGTRLFMLFFPFSFMSKFWISGIFSLVQALNLEMARLRLWNLLFEDYETPFVAVILRYLIHSLSTEDGIKSAKMFLWKDSEMSAISFHMNSRHINHDHGREHNPILCEEILFFFLNNIIPSSFPYQINSQISILTSIHHKRFTMNITASNEYCWFTAKWKIVDSHLSHHVGLLQLNRSFQIRNEFGDFSMASSFTQSSFIISSLSPSPSTIIFKTAEILLNMES